MHSDLNVVYNSSNHLVSELLKHVALPNVHTVGVTHRKLCGIRKFMYRLTFIFSCFGNLKFFYEYSQLNALSLISNESNILLFDYVFLPLAIYLSNNKKCKVHLFLWNSILNKKESVKIGRIQKYCNIYTFDTADTQKYGLSYLPQVMYQPAIQNIEEPDIDLYFVGKDKGRYEELNYIYKKLSSDGFKLKFIILPDCTSVPEDKEGLSYSYEYVSDKENLQNIANSKAILDIPQSNQREMTRRPLEAFFCNKKLVTISKDSLVSFDALCNGSSTFVLTTKTSNEKLRDFLSSKLFIDAQELNKYEINNWLLSFQKELI